MKRFKAQKMGSRPTFDAPGGFTIGFGWGIFDRKEGKYVSDAESNHPWEYNRASTAKEIERQFNELGPAGKLSYAKRYNQSN